MLLRSAFPLAVVLLTGCRVICGPDLGSNNVAVEMATHSIDTLHEVQVADLRKRQANGDGVAALQLAEAYERHGKGHPLRQQKEHWRKLAADANGTVSVPFRKGKVSFLKWQAAGALLSSEDEFVKAMSPFDRSARLQVARVVGQAEYLRHVHKQALDWELQEMVRMRRLLEEVSAKLGKRRLPWPGEIFLVKTTGREEAAAAYTRGSAIVLPRSKLKQDDAGLRRLLVHELFHVLSRANPDMAAKLYRIIGYTPSPPLEFPAELASLKITNPDAPFNRHAIEVEHESKKVRVTPILYSRGPYDEKKGGVFFRYLVFRLLVLDPKNPARAARDAANKLTLLKPNEAKGFREQIGGNTSYIIHPEETMADNFVFLVLGKKNLPTPGILKGMEKAFLSYKNN